MEVTLFSLSSSLTAMKHNFSCILSSSLILIETACCKDPACPPYFVWKFPWHTLLISFNSLVGQEYLKQKEGKGRHSHGLCPCEPRALIGGQFGVETQKCPRVLWLLTGSDPMEVPGPGRPAAPLWNTPRPMLLAFSRKMELILSPGPSPQNVSLRSEMTEALTPS